MRGDIPGTLNKICADCEPGARCPVDFMPFPSRSTSPDLLVVLDYETVKYPTMKALVTRMNAGRLSAQTVNSYFRMAAAVIASAEDADDNPRYPQKWDANKLDLSLVETSKQRRPSITAETMMEFARVKSPKYRMVMILAASAGCRIDEPFSLEIKDLLGDFTTVRIIRQAKGKHLTTELKTANSERLVDISPEVAALLKEFLAGRTTGLVFPNRGGTPLNPSNVCNRVIRPLLRMKGLPTGGNHIFRRFRTKWLRENSVSPDIERFWLGHANRTVGDDYSMLKNNIKFRKQIADNIWVGFELPNSVWASVVPNVPKTAVEQAGQAVA